MLNGRGKSTSWTGCCVWHFLNLNCDPRARVECSSWAAKEIGSESRDFNIEVRCMVTQALYIIFDTLACRICVLQSHFLWPQLLFRSLLTNAPFQTLALLCIVRQRAGCVTSVAWCRILGISLDMVAAHVD